MLKMYHDWRNYRNSQPHLHNILCNLDDISSITKDTLVFTVGRFLTEVKKLDGSDFPGRTLYDILICMQFHLETLGIHWHVLNDETLKEIRFTLDNLMKMRTAMGIGTKVRKAEVLTNFDKELLWNLSLLGE